MNFKDLITVENLFTAGTFILKPILILLICKIIIGVIMKVGTNILDKTKLDSSIKSFVRSAIKIGLWALTIVFVADSLGVNTASLVTVLGVVSLALSLSVQNIMTNIFSGITLLISKPFSVGDFVDIAGTSGSVKSINLMRTTLTTADNKIELIPNGDICAATIINYSVAEYRRVEWKFSASYDAETDKVKKAIMEVISEDNRIITAEQDETKVPQVRLNAYNPNDIEYLVRVWTNNSEYWNVYYDVNEKVRESFKKYKIDFSYPHTIVHIKKDQF